MSSSVNHINGRKHVITRLNGDTVATASLARGRQCELESFFVSTKMSFVASCISHVKTKMSSSIR